MKKLIFASIAISIFIGCAHAQLPPILHTAYTTNTTAYVDSLVQSNSAVAGTNTVIGILGYVNGNANGGSGNFFIGSAGNTNNTGIENLGFGDSALLDLTSGNGNVVMGAANLEFNTTGSSGTAIGQGASEFNTTGSGNTAIGNSAIINNSTGSQNTGVGYLALQFLNGGSQNIALGYQAGNLLIGGSGNIEVGNTGTATDTNIIRIGSSQTDSYIAGTLHATPFFIYTNFTAGQFVNNNFGALITVSAYVTNIWTASGIAEMDLIVRTNGGATSIEGSLMCSLTNGVAFTNVEMLLGYCSNGWDFCFTNKGNVATANTNFLRNGSGRIKAP